MGLRRTILVAGAVAWVASACGSSVVITGNGDDDGDAPPVATPPGTAPVDPPDPAPVCPGAPPSEGELCSAVGEYCQWGAGECVTTGVCTDTGWTMGQEGDCACPGELTVGETCADKGQACSYTLGAGCDGSVTMTCTSEFEWAVTENTVCDFFCPADFEDLPETCEPCCHHPCAHIDGCNSWWATCKSGSWEIVVTPC